jgi:hypothetical protein
VAQSLKHDKFISDGIFVCSFKDETLKMQKKVLLKTVAFIAGKSDNQAAKKITQSPLGGGSGKMIK